MYTYRNHRPLKNDFRADDRYELLLKAGRDGVLGESWEDENGAVVATGFFTYLLGEPTPGEETDLILRQACPYCVVPKSPAWLAYLDRFPHTAYTRTKMAPPDKFDEERLRAMAVSLPEGLVMRSIDEEMLRRGIVTGQELNIPQVFGDVESYLHRGFGFAVLDGDRAVSTVSSYLVHRGEAEVDISTVEAYRRRGLAAALCARFILTCGERGLVPSWDAQNPASAALAEKLGFSRRCDYDAIVLKKA